MVFRYLLVWNSKKVKDGMLLSGGISLKVSLKNNVFEQFRVPANDLDDFQIIKFNYFLRTGRDP